MKLLLEIRSAQAGLTDDGQECAYQDFFMIWNRDSSGAAVFFLLHHNVAAATPDFDEPMSRK